MGIKQKIKFKSVDRDRRTNSASSVSLDVSDDAKASDEARRSEVARSDLEGCHPDEEILKKEFLAHLKKFFKGQ